MLEVRDHMPVDLKSSAGGLTKDTALINSEMDVLRSSGLAQRVVDELGLITDPEFNPLLRSAAPGVLTRSGILDHLPRTPREWL